MRPARLALPYFRMELPGWGRLYRALGINDSDRWRDAPTKRVRLKWSNLLVDVDLSNWSERYTYFLRRFYDLKLQLLMLRVLRAGDRFVDVGANIGMITLHAAALVGPSGRVDSFEPNPRCCERMRKTLENNNLANVKLHQSGLSHTEGVLTLSLATSHTGTGTLAEPSDSERGRALQTYEVPVAVADDVLTSDAGPVRMVKIDVEGFELNVLVGMRQVLTRDRPIVVTEMEAKWLERAGTTRGEVLEYMTSLGYVPYGLATKRRRMRHSLHLEPIESQQVERAAFADFLWLHESVSLEAFGL